LGGQHGGGKQEGEEEFFHGGVSFVWGWIGVQAAFWVLVSQKLTLLVLASQKLASLVLASQKLASLVFRLPFRRDSGQYLEAWSQRNSNSKSSLHFSFYAATGGASAIFCLSCGGGFWDLRPSWVQAAIGLNL